MPSMLMICWNLPQPHSTCSNMRANEVITTWQTRLYIWPPTIFFIDSINAFMISNMIDVISGCLGGSDGRRTWRHY